MRVLELFSGTGSFSKVCREFGWKTFEIDNNSNFNPDLCKDILDLKLNEIPFKPDIIWASPPCTEYSKAKSRGQRDIEGANKLIIKTLLIINKLKPTYWFIENPQTGKLKEQSILNNLFYQRPYKDVSYCKYGFPYRKQTRIWTNCSKWMPREICRKDCGYIKDGRHIDSVGNFRVKYGQSKSSAKKGIIPRELCLEICLEIAKHCDHCCYCGQHIDKHNNKNCPEAMRLTNK